MKKSNLIVFAALFIISITSLFAQKTGHVPGEILVQFKKEVSISAWIQQHQLVKGISTETALREKVSAPMNIYAITFDEQKIDEHVFLMSVLQDKDVEVAQFNHYLTLRSTVPNDPQFNQQWQYINTGQSGGTAGADIDIDLAWDITTGGLTPQGDTIVVCVIDGGFETTHPDLAPNVWYNHAEIPNNNIDDDNNGFMDDYRGWNTGQNNDNISAGFTDHGTSVAGIVGAKGNDGIGVAGVNWNVKVMLVAGGTGVESEVLEAYSYPLTARKRYNETNGAEGAFVVATNASWGVDFGQPSSAPLWCAFYDSLGAVGILNCGATINNNTDVDVAGDLPTACPSDYLISVTNMNHNDNKVTFAGYGATTIDIGAFGEGTWNITNNGGYAPFGGTSGATPHVSGTIGLLYSAPCSNLISLAKADPGAAALLIRQYILDGGDVNASLQGITVTGDRLNVNNSMQLLLAACGPCPEPYNLGTQNLTDTQANLVWTSPGSAISDTLRWRVVGDTNWTVINGVSSPLLLNGLTGCTDYEFEVKSSCDTIASGYSSTYLFRTDGCCELPQNISLTGITETTTTATWESILAATGYNLRYRTIGTTTWVTATTTDTTIELTGLTGCTAYEIEIQTICDTTLIGFGSGNTFRTLGCGACLDFSYCMASTPDAAEEWIHSVSLRDINNTSGSNSGYGDFTASAISTELMTDSSYDLTITPGYSGASLGENVIAWIDYNADGDFDDGGELIYSYYDINSPTTKTITIPSDAVTGSTRMRINLSYGLVFNACDAPQSDNFGEIEDYCITIARDSVIDGIKETFEHITVAPNPFKDHLTINLSFRGANKNATLALVNGMGQVVQTTLISSEGGQQQTVIVNAAELKSGMYIVRITSSEGEYFTRKVIKQ